MQRSWRRDKIVNIAQLLGTYIWGAVSCETTKARSCCGAIGAARQQSIAFVNIVFVITVIVGAAFSIRYPSTGSPIKCEGLSLTCARPRKTSVFETVVVIGNVIIVVDISIIVVIFVFTVVQRLRR